MEIPENNSTLSINNSFFKLFKAIEDKRAKGESTTKEIEWIQSQVQSENPRIVANAVVLICSGEFGFALNSLVLVLPRLPINIYEIVADGIIQLLLLDVDKTEYKCQFAIQHKPHPLLQLIDESSEKMFYFSQRVVGILNNARE